MQQSHPDHKGNRDVDIAPRKRKELVPWLTKPTPEPRSFYKDKWHEVCQTRFFHSWSALRDLEKGDVWPAGRWREALQAWAEEGMVLRAWRYAAPLVQTMPDAVLQEIDHAVTWWVKTASQSINWDANCHRSILLNLCNRVLNLDLPLEAGSRSRIIRNGVETETYDPVGSAINHPIGHITQALINLWFKQNPNDNDLLPADLKPIFTTLCDAQIDRFRHGRGLMGSQLIAFFRVDRPWTEQYLLPLFGWSNPVQAKAVWEGFLLSPRLYQPLLTAFKSQFLDSATHYADLGERRQQFATFLTYSALGPTEGYTVEEFRSAIGSLPQEGLGEAAQALSQAIEGAADQREDYWKNRAQPFWHHIWPKSRDLATRRIAESLTRLVIAARGELPDALAAVQYWLQPIQSPDYVVNLLFDSGLCSRYPEDTLSLLSAVIVNPQYAPTMLGECLDQITQAAPNLAQDARYLRLREYCSRVIE